MNLPPPIEVEKEFSSFMKSFGAALVSEIVGGSPQFANADYLFREHNIVGELKCMTKDVLADEYYKTKISDAAERWIAAGKMSAFWGTARIETAALPVDCQREFFQILRKPVHGAIEKANRQIRETKTNLNLLDAKGLLLLVNDGCWSIESDAMLHLVNISLGRCIEPVCPSWRQLREPPHAPMHAPQVWTAQMPRATPSDGGSPLPLGRFRAVRA